jgi:hypothetical protein
MLFLYNLYSWETRLYCKEKKHPVENIGQCFCAMDINRWNQDAKTVKIAIPTTHCTSMHQI